MSAFENARNASVGLLTFIRDLVAHPLQMIQRGFVASMTYTTATPTLTTMKASYETPYVWSREFLEQSGYNLTERIPAILAVYEVPGEHYRQIFARRVVAAVPPQLIHELSLHWTFTLVEGVFGFFVSLDKFDVAWLLFEVSVCLLVYLCRRRLLPILASFWEELEQDVEEFCQHQFPPARQELRPAPIELPPGTITISAAEIEDMNASADAIQQRINRLRMSKYNFVRCRTGVIYKLNSPRKLQTQLTKAQEALKKEKAMKARVRVNFVRSRTGGVINLPAVNKMQTQLGKAQKALEAEKASHQETRDFLNHQSNGRADAEAELEALRARLETGGSELEGHAQLETIREVEDESPAADGTNPQKISEETTAEAAQVERLEAQLAVEQANYRFVFKKKEVFRQGGKKLKEELEDLQAVYNVLEDSRDTWKETFEALEQQADVKVVRALSEKIDSDTAHHERRVEALETQIAIEQTAREEAVEALKDLRERHEELREELVAIVSEQENPDDIYPGPDPHEHFVEGMKIVERHKAGMEEYRAKMKEMDEAWEKRLEAERVAMAEGHDQNDDNGIGADLAQADDTPNLLDPAEHTPTGMPLDDEQPANVPTAELSPHPSSLNGSVSAFNPSAHPSRSIPPIVPEHTPAPRVTGPEGVRNPHVQKLNQDVKRMEWRRKSGMPLSVDDEEGVAGLDDVLDDMYDRQVAQFQKFTPMPYARGSMWGALNDVPGPLENMSALSSPSTIPPSESNTNSNADHEIPHASGEDSGQKASTQADKSMKSPRDEEAQEVLGHNGSGNMGADEGIGNDGWSDFEDEHYTQEEDDGAPMLGKYKVTRGPPNGQGDDGLSMPGSYPAPDVGSSDISMLDKDKVTRREAPISGSSRAPKVQGESKAEVGRNDVDAGKENAKQENKEDHEKATEAEWKPKNDPKPLLPHLAHLATKGGLPHKRQTPRRRPSNYFPGIENATKTHAEEVGDAFTNYVREHAKGTLSDSMWAPKPDIKTREIPQKAPSRPAEGTALPVAQEQVNSGPDPKSAQDNPPPRSATRRPSNFFPGEENATKTQAEEVGDVFADFARERGILTLSDSIWAPKPDPKPDTKARVLPRQVVPPAAKGVASPHTSNRSEDRATTQAPTKRRPSNFFPGMENATKTEAEEVGDAFADYVREHATGKLSDSIWAKHPDVAQPTPQTAPSTAAKGAASPRTPIQSGGTAPHRAPPRGPPNFSLLPSPQPPPGAPTGPRGHAFSAGRPNSQVNTSVGLDNPDTTPRVRLPSPPLSQAAPLLEARNDFNILGASNRRPQQAQQIPPQMPPANWPRAQPRTPAPGNGNRNAGFGARGRGGGRGGRGGGLGTPAPRSGPRSGNATSESFQRLQENMARAEEEFKRRRGEWYVEG